MRLAGLFVLLIVCSAPLYGQLNDTVNYYVNLAATGIINRTEAANSYVFNNQLRANAAKMILLSTQAFHGFMGN